VNFEASVPEMIPVGWCIRRDKVQRLYDLSHSGHHGKTPEASLISAEVVPDKSVITPLWILVDQFGW
jgi:hypothetical protein